MAAAAEIYHGLLIEAYQEMTKQGLPPRQCVEALVKLGPRIVDDAMAAEQPKH
jgi:hypothetical protein